NLGYGGSSTHLVEVLAAARPQDSGVERVTLWCGRAVAERVAPRSWLDIQHVRELDGAKAYRAVWQHRLSRLAQQTSDVLLTPGQLYLGSFRPYVTMSRNLLLFDAAARRRYSDMRDRVRFSVLRQAQMRTLRRADGVIFLTKTARRVVERTTGRLAGLVATIPHGVAEEFRVAPRIARSIESFSADSPFRWIYVSSIEPYKHHDCVVEAAGALRRRGFPIRLDFVGRPTRASALRRLRNAIDANDSTGEFIRFWEEVPYRELAEWYRTADAAV